MSTHFLSPGADVYAKDNAGRTPLHYAAMIGRVDVVKALIAKGADVGAIDYFVKTPLDLTKNNKIKKILKAAVMNQK